MLDGIKRRLIHFKTDGKSIVSDFVSARQRRAGAFRRVIHACFYIQCAAALVCIVSGFAMGGSVTGLVLTVGAAASVAAALMAVTGEFVVRTVSYILNLVYSVICFILGGALFTLCGFMMLISAAAALCCFAAGYFRSYLLEFPPVKLTPENYTIIGAASQPDIEASAEPPVQPVLPKPQPKSELLLIAETVSRIMNTPSVNSTRQERTDDNTGERNEG